MKKNSVIRAASTLCLAAVIGVSMSSSASAYVLLEYRHEVPRVRYYYDTWADAKATTAFNAGAKAWRDATTSIVIDNGSSDGIQVYVNDTNDSEVDWDGITHCEYWDDTHYVKSVNVVFNSAKPAWNSASALQSVAAHEIGHVFGLDHLSPGVRAIMNRCTFGSGSRYETFHLTTPVSDDINGVNYIYG